MVRQSKYDRLLREYERTKAENDKLKKQIQELESKLWKSSLALNETMKQLQSGIETHNSTLEILKRLDRERLKVVNDKRNLMADNEKLRKIISDLEVDDKLDAVCSQCKWCDKDGGVTCVCPEECFFAQEGD